MGRTSGFIAQHVGIAGGAEIILTPEFPLSTNDIITRLASAPRKKLTSIIVAAESDTPGWTVNLANELTEKTGGTYKTCILGHIQRGGSPSVYDRLTATQMGYAAVNALLQGKQAGMIAVIDKQICLQDFPQNNTPRQLTDKTLLNINDCVSGC